MNEDVNIIIQALEKATKQGCFTITEVVAFYNAITSIVNFEKNSEKK